MTEAFVPIKYQHNIDGVYTMNLTVCTRICKECPFSKSSPKGWLGFHTLESVLAVQQEAGLFSCHLLRKEGMRRDEIE